MDEQWRTTPPQEVLEVQRIIDVACEACRKAENAGLLSRGRLRRAAARTVAEQSELLRRTAPCRPVMLVQGLTELVDVSEQDSGGFRLRALDVRYELPPCPCDALQVFHGLHPIRPNQIP